MIYICIPAHNEERTIGVVLWKIRQVMANFPRDYQILVADDGSTDATAEVLEPYQRVLPVTVFRLGQQRGYATALELLLREANRRAEYPKRDVIVSLQADFTEDPEHLAAMLKRIEAGADVVCTNVQLSADAPRPLRWARRAGNYLLQRRRWPEGVSDPASGFRAYRVQVVRKPLEAAGAKRLLSWDGWAANAELLRLVMPHARRIDVLETRVRIDRRQRDTRHEFWPAFRSLLGYAFRTPGPLQGTAIDPIVSPAPVESPVRRRRPQPSAETAKAPARDRPAQRRHAGSSRPTRDETERPARGKPSNGKPRPAAAQRRKPAPQSTAAEPVAAEEPKKKKRRRRRRPSAGRQTANGRPVAESAQSTPPELALVDAQSGETAPPAEKRRRRSRRGRGRRGRRNGNLGGNGGVSGTVASELSPPNGEPPKSEPPAPLLETGTD
ncbi:MAG TPA: glycosyltransferase [Longimicrobiales bacterium]|nr:glycosyltransferase [Longimicrobiales bacterium]